GPARRRREVLELAGLPEQRLSIPVHGPAGLDLGAELPEGVALSILAECHGEVTGARLVQLSDPAQARLQHSQAPHCPASEASAPSCRRGWPCRSSPSATGW